MLDVCRSSKPRRTTINMVGIVLVSILKEKIWGGWALRKTGMRKFNAIADVLCAVDFSWKSTILE